MKTSQSVTDLSWGQRFAIIDAYQLSAIVVCETFGCTTSELDTAIDLKNKGVFKVDTVMDVALFGELFGVAPVARTKQRSGPATKKVAEPKKRGRKGDKIQNAFLAVPVIPVPIEGFMAQQGVSLAVLRQAKRFDQTPLAAPRPIKVKKTAGVLMISRPEQPKAE